jgi:hypothetical protein
LPDQLIASRSDRAVIEDHIWSCEEIAALLD